MTAETVFVVQHDSPHSPMYPHRIFIDGTVYLGGVVEYMTTATKTPPDLLEAMMHMYTQHIHLQKIFQESPSIRMVHERPVAAWPWATGNIDATYEIIAREFRTVSDVRTVFDPETFDYVRRAQPACGLTRALELSAMWARKKTTQRIVRYDVAIEDELALYDIRDPMASGYK